MDKKYLFAVEDLHQAKHIPKVVRCLEEIEKLVTSFRPLHVLLSRFYPDFIQILSRFYPDFMQISSSFHPEFNRDLFQIF